MTPEEIARLQRSKAKLPEFLDELGPVLDDFIERLGIKSEHDLRLHVGKYAAALGQRLENMAVSDEDDRTWLAARMIYFVGEYFVQKYGGHWFVYDIPGNPMFGRYVVGQFAHAANPDMVVDLIQFALNYVDAPPPRNLVKKLADIDAVLTGSPH